MDNGADDQRATSAGSTRTPPSAVIRCVRVVLPAVAAMLLVSCSASPAAEQSPSPPVQSASASAGPTPADIEEAGAKAVDVTGDWLSVDSHGLWLSGPASVYHLDLRSGSKTAEIAVPQGPCEASAVGLGAVWTATCDQPGLARIDPVKNRVSAYRRLGIPPALEGEASIGVGAGSVWVVLDHAGCSACRLARIDPTTLRIQSETSVPPGSAGVRFGEGAVWVTNPDANTLIKVDPRGNKVLGTFPVGPQPRFLAVGAGAVWTLNQADGSVTRLDPTTGQTSSIALGFAGDGGDITVGAGSVWARGSDQLLARIDPTSHQVVQTYGPPSGSGAVIVAPDAVWLSAHDVGTLWRLPLPH